MAFPKYREIELPLLYEIDALGGKARPSELYDRLASYFPMLTRDDLKSETYSGGQNKWQNMVRWARFNLVKKGELQLPENAGHGNWAITQLGHARLNEQGHLLPRHSNADRAYDAD